MLLFLFVLFQCFFKAKNTIIPITDKNLVQLIGRFSYGLTKYPRADWPASSVRFFIDVQSAAVPTVVSLSFLSSGFYMTGLVDNVVAVDTLVQSPTLKVVLNATLPVGKHEIVFVKRNEATTGIMTLNQLSITNSKIVNITQIPPSFVFLGDSFTAGYGVDGVPPCSFSFLTENVLNSFPTLIKNHYRVDSHVLAMSGYGVVRNYAGSYAGKPFPDYYGNTLNYDSNTVWVASSVPAPAIVYVMLGINDYSTNPVPADADFIAGLVSLLQRVRTDYPLTKIVVLCPPANWLNQCANTQQAALQTGNYYFAVPPSTLNGGYGCDNHPSKQSQINVANSIIGYTDTIVSLPTTVSLIPTASPVATATLMPTVSSLKQYLDFGNKQYVELIGRYDSFRADWSGSAVRVSVKPENSLQPCTIQLSFVSLPTNRFYITVLVDGVEQTTIFIDSTHLIATVSPVLTTGVAHEIVFVKRTDSTTGIMQLDQLWIRDATIVSLPKKPLFLFLGDGITNGYGVDGIAGTTPYCNADSTNQNVCHAYPSFVSSFFGANYHSLAITPVGVVRNYGGYNPTNTFLSYFNNTLVLVSNLFYNFSSVSPQLVFVMLGTNDYSTAPVPSNSSFVQGFRTLLQQIKLSYPHSIVVSSCSPLFSSYQCVNIQKASTIENVPFVAVPSSIMSGGYGCSYLPNVASQQNIANIIVPFLQKLFSNALPTKFVPSIMPSLNPTVSPISSLNPTVSPISSLNPTVSPISSLNPTVSPTTFTNQKSESLTDKKYMIIWLPPVGFFFLVCFCVLIYYAKKTCVKPKHSIRVQLSNQNHPELEQNFTTV